MRVLAARFPDWDAASEALKNLHERLDAEVIAEIAPLGRDGVTSSGETLLAGHFPDDRTRDVIAVVHESGGEIVADVDERWTRPRSVTDDTPSDGGRGFSW